MKSVFLEVKSQLKDKILFLLVSSLWSIFASCDLQICFQLTLCPAWEVAPHLAGSQGTGHLLRGHCFFSFPLVIVNSAAIYFSDLEICLFLSELIATQGLLNV